jgi:molybdopterin-containing oxidoreductase family iron-sulfur binding subunit
VLVSTLNELLGNYGASIDLTARSYQRLGQDEALDELLEDLRNKRLDALFVAGCNPVYDLPDGDVIAAAPLLVVAAESLDETATAAAIVCAEPHYLEAWAEAEPIEGVATLSQPALQPFGDTRPLLETLAAWLGQPQPAREQIAAWWRAEVHPRAPHPRPLSHRGERGVEAAGSASFDSFFNQALARGFAELGRRRLAIRAFNPSAATAPRTLSGDGWDLMLYPSVAMLDGRHAENPWLQELPDPLTKTTWDNVACLSAASAAELGVSDGEAVDIAVDGRSLSLPACLVPGQAERTVAVALGYGRQGTARFADLGYDWYAAQPSVNEDGVV